jgi:hypothetical protein
MRVARAGLDGSAACVAAGARGGGAEAAAPPASPTSTLAYFVNGMNASYLAMPEQ